MGKRKARNTTLTKIDPRILTPKPVAVSQHAAHDGTRVTTTVNPVCAPPVSSIEPLAFGSGPGDVDEDLEEDSGEDDDDDDDISKGYYAAQVIYILPATISND